MYVRITQRLPDAPDSIGSANLPTRIIGHLTMNDLIATVLAISNVQSITHTYPDGGSITYERV